MTSIDYQQLKKNQQAVTRQHDVNNIIVLNNCTSNFFYEDTCSRLFIVRI